MCVARWRAARRVARRAGPLLRTYTAAAFGVPGVIFKLAALCLRHAVVIIAPRRAPDITSSSVHRSSGCRAAAGRQRRSARRQLRRAWLCCQRHAAQRQPADGTQPGSALEAGGVCGRHARVVALQALLEDASVSATLTLARSLSPLLLFAARPELLVLGAGARLQRPGAPLSEVCCLRQRRPLPPTLPVCADAARLSVAAQTRHRAGVQRYTKRSCNIQRLGAGRKKGGGRLSAHRGCAGQSRRRGVAR